MEEFKSKRLRAVVNHLRASGKVYNDADFSRKINRNRSMVSEYLSGKRPVTPGLVADIKQAFPEVNENFILESGESPMFVAGGNVVMDSYVEGGLSQNSAIPVGNPDLLEKLIKDLMDQNAALVAQVDRMLGLVEKLQTR